MKPTILFFIAPLLLAGCTKREPQPSVVIAPPPPTATPAPTLALAPTAAPGNKIIIVQPTARPGTIVIKPPPVADNSMVTKPPVTDETVTNKPAPKPPPVLVPRPTSKPAPTAKPKPIVKPAPRPTAKPSPTAKPAPKPTAKPRPKPTAIAADAQSAPTLIVRAQVVSSSKVPDPNTVAYSDSLVFSKYRVLSVEKGSYQPQEILVAQWGMKGKKLTPAARLRAGDVATLKLVPLDEMPTLERIMRNDDTGDYDSTPYFALDK